MRLQTKLHCSRMKIAEPCSLVWFAPFSVSSGKSSTAIFHPSSSSFLELRKRERKTRHASVARVTRARVHGKAKQAKNAFPRWMQPRSFGRIIDALYFSLAYALSACCSRRSSHPYHLPHAPSRSWQWSVILIQ